jgi:hypothetical protein
MWLLSLTIQNRLRRRLGAGPMLPPAGTVSIRIFAYLLAFSLAHAPARAACSTNPNGNGGSFQASPINFFMCQIDKR